MSEEKNPAFGILTQSVTDLSFENFVNLNFKPAEGEEPKMDIQVKVNSEKTKEENVYSVALGLKVSAKAGSASIFLLELTYTGLFVLENFKDDVLAQILNIECPRLLFPFARAVVASTVASGNMPMPLLPPIDFAELYFKSLQEKEESK